MKVIFVNRYVSPDQSATSRMITSIASALAQRGYEVVAVASRHLHNEDQTVLPPNEVISGIKVVRLTTSHFGRLKTFGRAIDYFFFHLSAFTWLVRHASRDDIAVVCTDPPFLSVTTAVALRLRGASSVNWVMDLFPETAIELGLFKRSPIVGRLARSLRNWSIGTSAAIACPTTTMADYLRDELSPRCPISLLRQWSDGKEIYPIAAADNELRTEWGLDDKLVIGYSGNFGRAHEFDTILNAAALLRDQPDIRFLMIGNGHQHARVVDAAKKLGLDNMIFKPLQPAENLAKSLCAADVHLVSLLPQLEHCIIPSKFYGILAAGRPTIFIGDLNGEVARVIDAYGCGKNIAIGEGQRLAAAIRELRDDTARRLEMGQIARRVLTNDYSYDQAIDKWCALLDRLDRSGDRVPHIEQRVSP
ncbi:glycosyltransferase WbuB [Neorhizobium sp. P12A]|uniref:glycosyltransferase family 4 protein n=1 Tax=Neorhizobium sp. P12A TaxID=2268027 RepID=UPI0011EE638B|nr:glycosyltransferase family 4 protein [Neorhizobium sp. P12A]KAA0700236.1 glycosyltransferase WbuB [Neorhizobium sp. P12A]